LREIPTKQEEYYVSTNSILTYAIILAKRLKISLKHSRKLEQNPIFEREYNQLKTVAMETSTPANQNLEDSIINDIHYTGSIYKVYQKESIQCSRLHFYSTTFRRESFRQI
jgi:hypothetical protein